MTDEVRPFPFGRDVALATGAYVKGSALEQVTRQAAYDALPEDADDDLYELADRVHDAVLAAASGAERPIDETQVIEWLEEEGVVIWGDEGHRQRFLDILAAERAIPATDAEGSSHDQA